MLASDYVVTQAVWEARDSRHVDTWVRELQVTLTREYISKQGILTGESHASTQGTLACEHESTEVTLAREHVSTQDKWARKTRWHVSI